MQGAKIFKEFFGVLSDMKDDCSDSTDPSDKFKKMMLKKAIVGSVGSLMKRLDFSRFEITYSVQYFMDAVADDKLLDFYEISNSSLALVFKNGKNLKRSHFSLETNHILGAYIQSYNNVALDNYLLKAASIPSVKIHYLDCDSLALSLNLDDVSKLEFPLGFKTGQVKESYIDITKFFSLGEKAYMVHSAVDGHTTKLCGFSQEHKHIHDDDFKDLLKRKVSEIVIPQMRNGEMMNFSLRFYFMKNRIVLPTPHFITLPWGFSLELKIAALEENIPCISMSDLENKKLLLQYLNAFIKDIK